MRLSTKLPENPIDPERLRRPNLAADVRLHEPMDGSSSWFLQRGGRQYFAITPDFARVIGALDGARDHQDLAGILGPPWAAKDVELVVRKLADSRMLDDGTKRRRDSWIRFVPPLTVQLKVMNPERLLARLTPVIRLLAGRAGMLSGSVIAFLGLLALVFQGGALNAALGKSLPFITYLAIVAGVLATTALHEMGHGAVLTYYGGRPSRMGVMLFYLSPAFFCDVSDGWRLPRKEQRVRVALAGIGTQAVIGGLAAIVALFVGSTAVRDGALVFAVVTYVAGVLNLVPFVKLDGYIALMCQVNVPHLRDRAMVDARRWTARILFGGRHVRELPQLGWAVPYGLACMVFPVYLIANAMVLWVDILQRMGVIGAALMSFGICYLAYHLVRGFVRLVREGRTAGGRTWRVIGAAALLTAGIGTLLSFATLPYTIAGGYVTRDGGQVELVLPTTADRAQVRAGAEVRLYQAGLVTRKQTGSARVETTRASSTNAPLSALLPVQADALTVPSVGYPLTVAQAPTDRIGAAALDGGRMPLGKWLYVKYVAPAFRW